MNNSANKNIILKNYPFYDGIEEPSCPRAHFKVLNEACENSEETAAKLYWRELYIEPFDIIINDLNDKISSEQYKICAEIEDLLLNGITEKKKR